MSHQPTNGQLPLICDLRKPGAIEVSVVTAFGDDEELAIKAAIKWAWENKRVRAMSQRSAAESLGMRSSHFSNVLAGKKNLPLHKLTHFEWLVGNTAVTQTVQLFRERHGQDIARHVTDLFAEHLGRAA